MATRVLLNGSPVNAGSAYPSASYAATAYGRSIELGITEPLVVAAGNSSITDPIVVAGLTGFMLIFTPTGGGGTTTFSVQHCDPFTQAAILTRQIAAAIAPGIAQGFAFGSYATASPAFADVFHTIRLVFAAVVAQQTYNSIVLYGHAR